MKGKILVVAVLVLVGLVLLVNGQQARASIEPIMAFDDVFTELNAGDVDSALEWFAEDATAENKVRAETYRGADEIRKLLEGMQYPGRKFEIVEVSMNGDTVTARVEVSDRGHTWGTETIEAVVLGGKVQSFWITAFRLELWRIGR